MAGNEMARSPCIAGNHQQVATMFTECGIALQCMPVRHTHSTHPLNHHGRDVHLWHVPHAARVSQQRRKKASDPLNDSVSSTHTVLVCCRLWGCVCFQPDAAIHTVRPCEAVYNPCCIPCCVHGVLTFVTRYPSIAIPSCRLLFPQPVTRIGIGGEMRVRALQCG